MGVVTSNNYFTLVAKPGPNPELDIIGANNLENARIQGKGLHILEVVCNCPSSPCFSAISEITKPL
jgi:hypothetical protein